MKSSCSGRATGAVGLQSTLGPRACPPLGRWGQFLSIDLFPSVSAYTWSSVCPCARHVCCIYIFTHTCAHVCMCVCVSMFTGVFASHMIQDTVSLSGTCVCCLVWDRASLLGPCVIGDPLWEALMRTHCSLENLPAYSPFSDLCESHYPFNRPLCTGRQLMGNHLYFPHRAEHPVGAEEKGGSDERHR